MPTKGENDSGNNFTFVKTGNFGHLIFAEFENEHFDTNLLQFFSAPIPKILF